MRALVFVAIVLSSSVASAGGALKVKMVPPKRGEVAEVVSRISSDLKGTINGTKVAQTIEIDERWTQEYLAVDKDVVTKERVSFSAAHQKLSAGAPADDDLPIAKQTYVATASGGKVVFTDATGAEVGALVRGYLATAIDNVGQPDKTMTQFSGKEFTKGVAVSLSASELTSLLGNTDQLSTSSVTLTLLANDGKRARFELAGTIEGEQGGMHVTTTLAGTTTIDLARGRMVEADIGVQMKSRMSQGKDTTDVDGKVEIHRAATYR